MARRRRSRGPRWPYSSHARSASLSRNPAPRRRRGRSRGRIESESKRNQTRIKTISKANQNRTLLLKREREIEKKTLTCLLSPPNPPEGDSREFRALGFVDPDDLPSDEPGEFERFAAECIDAFNTVTGKDYRSTGGKDWLDLRRIYDPGRTVEDVRKVVAAKQEQWADSDMAKFIRPSTLFGAKFEEYLNEGEGAASDESDWDFD